eukprot:PhF_6_TR19007/c0_g1_i1/m.27862
MFPTTGILIKYGPTQHRGYALHDLFYSNKRRDIVTRSELGTEVDSYMCYACRREVTHEEAASQNGCCVCCYQCPQCSCPLQRIQDSKREGLPPSVYLTCQNCFYHTQGRLEGADLNEWVEKFAALKKGAQTTQEFQWIVDSLQATARTDTLSASASGGNKYHVSLTQFSDKVKGVTALPVAVATTPASPTAKKGADTSASLVPLAHTGHAITTTNQRKEQNLLSETDIVYPSRMLPVPMKLSTRMTWTLKLANDDEERLVRPSKFPDNTYQICLSCTRLLPKFSIRYGLTHLTPTTFQTTFLLWNPRSSAASIEKIEVVRRTNCSVKMNLACPITMIPRDPKKAATPIELTVEVNYNNSDKVQALQWVWEVNFVSDVEGNRIDLTYFVMVTLPKTDYANSTPATPAT